MAAEFWIIAGPNGAGKTTLTQAEPLRSLLSHVRFLNPDDEALSELRARGYADYRDAPPDVLRAAFVEAADRVLAELNERLEREEAVAVETVMSTNKYRPVVERILQSGGYVRLIYVALRSPALAIERALHRAFIRVATTFREPTSCADGIALSKTSGGSLSGPIVCGSSITRVLTRTCRRCSLRKASTGR